MCLYRQDRVSKDNNLKSKRLRKSRGELPGEETYERKVQANKEKEKIDFVVYI